MSFCWRHVGADCHHSLQALKFMKSCLHIEQRDHHVCVGTSYDVLFIGPLRGRAFVGFYMLLVLFSPAAGGSPVIFFSALSFSSDFDRGTYELSIHHG